MRRVVVTGIGLLTSLGNDKNKSWKNLIDGKSGIKKVDQFDVSDLPCLEIDFIEDLNEARSLF